MATPLKKWITDHVKKMEKFSNEELSEILFHRDEFRACTQNKNYFTSPADGIIIFQQVVDDKNPIEIKGKNYTLKEIMNDNEFNKKCLVIGIFMTFYDVHINRIPYPGILSFKEHDPIISNNLPMLATELGIFDNDKRYAKSGMDYMFYNQRMINTIYAPDIDLRYYIVQIADEEVDLIVPFTSTQQDFFMQNDRFGIIRYGSQCELIIPIDDRYEYELLCNDWDHVEAGIDKLVKINKKGQS